MKKNKHVFLFMHSLLSECKNLFLFFTILFFFLVPERFATASEVVVLTDQQQEYIIAGDKNLIYEDLTGKLSIDQVVDVFNTGGQLFVEGYQVNNPNAVYWVKFTVQDLSSGKYHWLLEYYDNRLDQITLYVPDTTGNYTVYEAGDQKKFKEKDFQHINFVFQLPPLSGKPTEVYLRLHSKHEIYIYGLIRSVQRYVDYTTNEYFFVSIFYGILLAMAVYNLLMLISVRDSSYVYYVLYVLSTAFYSLSRDGMGFQFIWPNHPEFNPIAEPLGLYFLAVTLLLYAREFLNTRVNNPVLDKLILVMVVLRTVVFIVGIIVSGKFIRNIYMDFPPMLLAYVAGFWSYRRGFKASRYYIIGFTFLFVGFCLIVGEVLGIALNDVLSFYSFNIGVVFQLLVLSFALGDKLRFIIKEKNEAQEKLIVQLKEKESLKDQINLQLEEKVKERTRELEQKNAQLDSFVYKASHDIKGPLRSLMGLTKVGMVDFQQHKEVAVYFQHIMKTASKLDVILEDLLAVTKLKTAVLKKSKIDFDKMMQEILDSFSHFVGHGRLKVSIDRGSDPIVTDEKVLYSILQNLTENAIKYQDTNKPEAWLKISVTNKDGFSVIVFEDNGAGIDPSHLAKIFEMFYKVNEKSIGSGLGLYIVKEAIDKLKGEIEVISTKGKGSKFIVKIPNA